MKGNGKKILLAPLDPVHDVGLRLIARGLEEHGYETVCLPPDTSVEEVIGFADAHKPDAVLVGRTISYQVTEIMARLADLMDAAGLREKGKVALGGMAVKPELVAELGFDAAFGPGTRVEEVIAFLEDRESSTRTSAHSTKQKVDVTEKYTYGYRNREIGALLDTIADAALEWSAARSSPGLERARLRRQMLEIQGEAQAADVSAVARASIEALRSEYVAHCDNATAAFYRDGTPPRAVRLPAQDEIDGIIAYAARYSGSGLRTQHTPGQPMVFVQYGTGCPLMDIAHIKTCEAWGADGLHHFDPTWSANSEGLLEGYLSHQDSGTVYTPEIIRLIKRCLSSSTVWTLRSHRGLNTPEIVVLAGLLGADGVRMNPIYGCLSGGTEPERMMVDGIEAMRYAAEFGLPFDVPVGHELSGVPTEKTLASVLISAALGIKVGARPILNPLFCYSPSVILGGQMEDNYVDFNVARVGALRRILDAPIRAGEPVAFMTHTGERTQSAVTTALHAALAMSLETDAVTIASTDEAYAGGPITVPSRTDTLIAIKEAFRFFGGAKIAPTAEAEKWTDTLMEGIFETLTAVAGRGDLVAAVYEGLLGDRRDGACPGRFGKGTVTEVA